MTRVQIIILLLFVLIDIKICSARSLISSSNCIIGYQSADSNLITVRPTSNGCYSKCNEYCLEKFKLYNGSNDNQGAKQDKDLVIFMSGVTSANKDRLESCLVSCYNGQRFDTKVRVPIRIDSNSGKSIDDTGELPYPWRCDIKSQAKDLNDLSCNYKSEDFSPEVNSTCSKDELEGAFYGPELSFKAGDTLSVNVSNIIESNSGANSFSEIITTEPNNIYLCGFKTVFFSPEYFIKSKPFKGDAPTNTLFSPRNNKRINTGIKVKTGDSIKIQYMGRYNSYCPGNNCKIDNDDYKIDIFIGQKKVEFDVSPYQLNDYDDAKKKSQSNKCEVCSQNSSDPICSTVECGYYQDKISKYGLNVSTVWLGSPNIFKVQTTNNIFETYSQFRSTILSGKIQDGSNGDELIIQYPDIPSNNQQGGYFASIEWRGCNFKDGERLQYTIVNEVLMNSFNFDSYMISPNGPKWQDLTMKRSQDGTAGEIKINSGSLNIPNDEQFGFNNDPSILSALPKEEKDYKGKIFFRIKLLNQGEVKYLDPSSISRANTVGSYNLKIVNLTSSKGFLQDLVDSFVQTLTGIPKKIFNGFHDNSKYLIIVRLVLIFYIAFTGFMFMSGMAQITQQEAVIRITKIAIVLMLLTENSFEFFNNYLFQGFGFNSINFLANTFTPEIQMDMAPGLTSSTSDCFAAGVPVKMLCVLEKDLVLFFQWSFWNRILGLASSGFFIAAVGITIGIIMYATVIIKITALYCVSLLSMTITISLAPIFLPLMLFKYTNSFFNSWIKQLISLLLQPVFIFVSISLFRVLFIVLVQSLMGNGACKMCWLEFFNWCWFEVYIPLSLGSSPSFASMPMSKIGVLLALYFVGHGMYSFCDEVTKMGNRMISFSLFNISSAKVGVGDMYGDAKKFGSMTYNIATAPLDLMAIDDKSMDQRQQMRNVRRDKQNNNAN